MSNLQKASSDQTCFHHSLPPFCLSVFISFYASSFDILQFPQSHPLGKSCLEKDKDVGGKQIFRLKLSAAGAAGASAIRKSWLPLPVSRSRQLFKARSLISRPFLFLILKSISQDPSSLIVLYFFHHFKPETKNQRTLLLPACQNLRPRLNQGPVCAWPLTFGFLVPSPG